MYITGNQDVEGDELQHSSRSRYSLEGMGELGKYHQELLTCARNGPHHVRRRIGEVAFALPPTFRSAHPPIVVQPPMPLGTL
jgi:hypothetical protein